MLIMILHLLIVSIIAVLVDRYFLKQQTKWKYGRWCIMMGMFLITMPIGWLLYSPKLSIIFGVVSLMCAGFTLPPDDYEYWY